LALHLAQRGVGVALVDHGRAHYSGPFETVIASTKSTWQRMGLLETVADGVAEDPLRHGAIWGSDALQWRQGEEAGLLLRRGIFDQALRATARDAGAEVYEGGRVERVEHGWQLLAGDGEPILLQPTLLAYATGRAALPGLPKSQPVGPETTAVTVLGEPASDDRGSAVVEAVRTGWIWTHVPRTGEASAAVLVDRELLKDRNTEDVIEAMFAEALGPARRLRNWRVAHANDATMWNREAASDCLLLGDAAATIDPLASQGVEKAISAAEHASVVIATALEHPEWWGRLRGMHTRWEHGLQAAHSRSANAFYEVESRFAAEPFWQRRQVTGPDPTQVSNDQVLRKSTTVQTGRVLMRHGPRIIEVDGAMDTATGEELARISRASVAAVLGLFREPVTFANAVALASKDPSLFVLTPHDVHEAIVQLVMRRWLVAGESAS
jgi:2-polyprenyl-6-methoxyphenol hydroxylase-like FAD-dependent oxidoreductase